MTLRNHKWRQFEEARQFVRNLRLHTYKEWCAYVLGELPEKPQLPTDIPEHPGYAYRQAGWQGYRDWRVAHSSAVGTFIIMQNC